MLDHLKDERKEGFGPQERMRLSLFVAGLLILGSLFFTIQSCPAGDTDPTASAPDVDAPPPLGEMLDTAELRSRAYQEVRHPDGTTERLAIRDEWAVAAIDYLRTGLEGEPTGERARRVTVQELNALPLDEALGNVYEVVGVVSDRTREQFQTQGRRLWSFVLDGPGSGQIVAIKPTLASDTRDEGAPRASGVGAPQLVLEGQEVIVRGIYVQQRTGTIGGTSLNAPVAVLFATAFRHRVDPDERLSAPEDLAELDWNLKDRFMRDTRKWEEPVVFQIIQWARARGYERIREDIRSGAWPWKEWDQDRFGVWQAEVRVRPEEPRTFTEGARGQLFKTSGLLANDGYLEWRSIPVNAWGIDDLYLLDLFSDYYGNTVIRTLSPFSPETLADIRGEKNEHIDLYGIFVKNYTYDTKYGSTEGVGFQPLTVPLFVVLHAERIDEGEAAAGYKQMIRVIGAVIVILGIAFYLVLVRGERKQARKMEEHRRRLRQRMREKGQWPGVPPKPARSADDPGEGGT